MRKSYLFLLLTILCSGLWTTARAGYVLGDQKSSFADGDMIVMQGAASWTNYFLSGNGRTGVSEPLTDASVWVLEKAGASTMGGDAKFYLKQKSSSLYLGGPVALNGDKEQYGVPMTDKSLAISFEILPNTNPIGARWMRDAKGSTVTDKSCAFVVVAGADTVVLANYTDATPDLFPYADTGAWNVYSVTFQQDARQDLQDLITYYEGLSLNYPSGTAPGTYPVAAVTRYTTALATANAQVNNNHTDAEYIAYAAELKAAKENVDTLAAPVTDGYYFIRNAYPNYYAQQSAYKAMYSKGSTLMWASIDSTSTTFMFKVTTMGKGIFSIQNVATGQYIGQQLTTSANVPMSNGAMAQTFKSLGYGEFNIMSEGGAAYHTGGHSNGAGKSGNVVVWAGPANTASAWYLDVVTDDLLAAAQAASAQQVRNDKFATLLTNAKKAYASALVYKNLVTDANDAGTGQYISNMKETSEGSYAALIDNNTGTYFHSNWQNPGTAKHFLQADLKAAYENIRISTYRRTQNNNNRPTHISIYGTNDATIAANLDMANIAKWDSLTALSGLPTAATVNDYTSPKISFPKAYQYVRFVVDSTSNSTVFFTYSEFHIQSGDYDPTLSQVNKLGALYTNLGTAITDGSALVAANAKITEEQMNALQTAYDNYMAAFVDSTRLTGPLTAAKALVAKAVEGDAIGQFATGSKATFQAAIDAASAFNYVAATRAEFDAAVTALTSAQKTFIASLKKFETGKWYYIINQMAAAAKYNAYGNGIYASAGDATSGISWGGGENSALSDVGLSSPYYMWRMVATSDSTYAIQNMGSSFYMGSYPGSLSVQYKMSASKVDYAISYYGNGAFTIKPNASNAVTVHADRSGAVVGWAPADNNASMWTFQPVESQEAMNLNVKPNSLKAYCFPFPIGTTVNTDVHFYQVSGITGTAGAATGINLHEVTNVAAGTPFVMSVGDPTQYDAADDSTVVAVTLIYDDAANVVIAETAGQSNGLVGNYASKSISQAGLGILNGKALEAISAATNLSANSAYINEKYITSTGEATSTTLTSTGTLNAITSATTDGTVNVNIYDLSGKVVAKGVKASAAGLAKGIYIIGTKKVSVK